MATIDECSIVTTNKKGADNEKGREGEKERINGKKNERSVVN